MPSYTHAEAILVMPSATRYLFWDMGGESISRRDLLLDFALVSASALLAPSRVLASDDRAQLAEEAFIWGVPLVLTGRYLDIARNAGVPFNQFVLSPDLATPKTRALGPQVDTLYGLGWLDLTQGAQVIEVPDTHDRYYSIQLIDTYANSFAYIGRRATGTKAGAFAVTPPDFTGSIPQGVQQVKAPTSMVLAFVRTLVRGSNDLSAARAVHGSYSLGTLSDYPKGRKTSIFRTESLNIVRVVDLSGAGAGYFDELSELLAAYPPPAYDAPNLARFATIGLVPGKSPPSDPSTRTLLASAIPAGLNQVRQSDFTRSVNGWRTKLTVINFIRDPLLRASTNLYGPGTHVAEEALYFTAQQGPDGKRLNGRNRYRLRFPSGQTPPVNAFWSVGLYTKDFFLYDNIINRYSVTDRTEGIRLAPDGALEIEIQHTRPPSGPNNWLPAPDEDFSITVRTYQPRPEVLNQQYKLPPLELV
jgi:hypothetical protein